MLVYLTCRQRHCQVALVHLTCQQLHFQVALVYLTYGQLHFQVALVYLPSRKLHIQAAGAVRCGVEQHRPVRRGAEQGGAARCETVCVSDGRTRFGGGRAGSAGRRLETTFLRRETRPPVLGTVPRDGGPC